MRYCERSAFIAHLPSCREPGKQVAPGQAKCVDDPLSLRSMQTPIRVAIFEDNALFREAMQSILNGTPGFTCCGSFEDCSFLTHHIEKGNPDVVLMDIEMPGINGIEATREIRNHFPGVKILIQTVFNDSERIFQSMLAGASGYILKNDPPNRYLDAIREVHEGGAPMSTVVAKKVMGFFTNKNIVLMASSSEEYGLSIREKEVLGMMMEGESYKSIAEKIFISYNTVRSHVQKIYQKLHVASRNEAIMKAVQQKLV